MKKVYVVIDSQGAIVGVFAKQAKATAVADSHCYFCKVIEQEVK